MILLQKNDKKKLIFTPRFQKNTDVGKTSHSFKTQHLPPVDLKLDERKKRMDFPTLIDFEHTLYKKKFAFISAPYTNALLGMELEIESL